MELVVISGVSGSGKSTALHVLEDLGYYCIDNLPLRLLPAFAQQMDRGIAERFGVGVDARNPAADLAQFPEILQQLHDAGIQARIVYIDAADAILLKRFSETRRKHPLTQDGRTPLADAIVVERKLLEPIASRADLTIDTTRTNIHQLRDLVKDRLKNPVTHSMSILFQSFGYKHGVPTDADLVFDVRCLPNPHWEGHLRELTGLDRPVADYLEKQALTHRMYDDIHRFLDYWFPRFEEDNRAYMTVAIGCTGGQHRSVYLTQRLVAAFRERYPEIITRHRDLV